MCDIYSSSQEKNDRKLEKKKSVQGMVSGKSVTMGNPLMAVEYMQYSKGTE